MKHAAFHESIRRLAGSRYFSTKVEVNERPGEIYIEFSAYIDGRGWSGVYRRADDVIRELSRQAQDEGSVRELGDASAEFGS